MNLEFTNVMLNSWKCCTVFIPTHSILIFIAPSITLSVHFSYMTSSSIADTIFVGEFETLSEYEYYNIINIL